MRTLILTLSFLLTVASCSADSNLYQFYGKIRSTKDHQFYLQVFPGQTRMYRIFLKGQKIKLAPFLNRSVGFKGVWRGDRKDHIVVHFPIRVIPKNKLNLAPTK